MDEVMMEFRRKYRGYRPWGLAKVRGTDVMYEFTSYPWQEDDGVYVNARVLDDPTTNARFKVRAEIGVISWGQLRQKAYREGWKGGQAYMRSVRKQFFAGRQVAL